MLEHLHTPPGPIPAEGLLLVLVLWVVTVAMGHLFHILLGIWLVSLAWFAFEFHRQRTRTDKTRFLMSTVILMLTSIPCFIAYLCFLMFGG